MGITVAVWQAAARTNTLLLFSMCVLDCVPSYFLLISSPISPLCKTREVIKTDQTHCIDHRIEGSCQCNKWLSIDHKVIFSVHHNIKQLWNKWSVKGGLSGSDPMYFSI